MGRRKKKSKRSNKGFEMACDQPQLIELDTILRNKGAKEKSKLTKKLRKKLAREQLSRPQDSQGAKESIYWHKVSVESSVGVDKKFLLDSVANYVDVEFSPLGFHKENNSTCFYLENNRDAANSMKTLDRRIQGSDGKTMKITVTSMKAPDVIPNANQLILLKEVIAKRFNSAICLLDLSSFHMDPFLVENDILVPLSSSVIMKTVTRIIKENIGNLKALNLSNNNLCCDNLKHLEDLSSSIVNLSAINLESNNIQNFAFLKYIKMFPLVELNLNSNPVLRNAQNTQSYINNIRKTFPNIKMLDNTEINSTLHNSPLRRDQSLQSTGQVGETTSQIMVNEASLQCFLEQYFLQFDSPQRVNLVQAYVPEAKVTLHSLNPQIPSTIFEGLEALGRFLSSLPETKHVHSSFKLNIIKVEPSEGCAEISGICHFNGLQEPLNFVRRMIVVPYKAGLCCSTDLIELK